MANMYNNSQFNPSFLSQNQQDLLMAALQSQSNQSDATADALSNRDSVDFSSASLDPSMLTNQPDGLYGGDLDFSNFNDQQLFDFLDSNNQPVDMDFDEPSPEGDSPNNHVDPGEKRKSMADDKADNENGAKRREGEEKQAKKPGRKPLTSEPTSKRKAQNRAAQRAFRERKEKHLKDLETKVSELEKTTESTSHENGLLRAQVERLQMELREYRKRLSVQSNIGRSPPTGNLGSFSNGSEAVSNYSFDFPRSASVASVSSVPYANMPLFGTGSMQTSPNSASIDFGPSGFLSRHTSTDATSPISNNANTPASDLRSQHGSVSKESPKPFFGQSMLNNGMNARASASPSSYNIFGGSNITAEPLDVGGVNQNGDSTGQTRGVFQFNSNSSSSPSASTSSQYGGNGPSSSAGTSPEPTTGVNKDSNNLDTINEVKQKEFYDQMSTACGNTKRPEPLTKSMSGSTSAPSTDAVTANSNPFSSFTDGNVDIFSASWPEASESNTNFVADGSFAGGYFNEPSSLFGVASPMDWNDLTGSMRTGLTPAQQKANPFEVPSPMPKIKEEEVVPGDAQMISCNKIWDKIQQRPDFKDGSLDIDGLCSELRKKAKCSETGVVIDKNDVDAALQRLPGMR
jgi:AP-1-like factor